MNNTKSVAADGVTETVAVQNVGVMVSCVDFNRQYSELAATKQKLEALEAEREEDAKSVLRLLATVKYLAGIAERGRGEHIDDAETAEQFVLCYVKQLESTVATLKAERKELEKQEPVAYRYEYESDLNGDKQGNWPYEPVTHVVFLEKKLDHIATPLYARPLPAPELQKRVDELEAELMDGKVCDQCTDGDGWNYNAVEGRVPCVCMTEAEPYQLLQEENAELTKKLAEQQAIIKQVKDYGFNRNTDVWNICVAHDKDGAEELTTLLSAARTEGIEEGKKMAGALADVANERARQQAKWDGVFDDEKHTPLDWHEMIADYNGWARRMACMGSADKARTRYIQIAALAVAAVEAIDAAAPKPKEE